MTNERIEKVIELLKDHRDICLGIADDDRRCAEYNNGVYNRDACLLEAKYYQGKADGYEYIIAILNDIDRLEY